jgi:hypothetical protein
MRLSVGLSRLPAKGFAGQISSAVTNVVIAAAL